MPPFVRFLPRYRRALRAWSNAPANLTIHVARSLWQPYLTEWTAMVSHPRYVGKLPAFSYMAWLSWVNHYEFWSAYWRSIQLLRIQNVLHPVFDAQSTTHWRHTDAMVLEGLRIGNTTMLLHMPREHLDHLVRTCHAASTLIHPKVLPRVMNKLNRTTTDPNVAMLLQGQKSMAQQLPWCQWGRGLLTEGFTPKESGAFLGAIVDLYFKEEHERTRRLTLLGHCLVHPPKHVHITSWCAHLQRLADTWNDGWDLRMIALCSGLGEPSTPREYTIRQWGRDLHAYAVQRRYPMNETFDDQLVLSPTDDGSMAMLAQFESIRDAEGLYLALENVGFVGNKPSQKAWPSTNMELALPAEIH